MKLLNKLFKGILYIVLTAGFFVVVCNLWVVLSTKDQLYGTVDELPENKVGLLLGTSKFFRSGNPNTFFRYRVEAAANLVKAGKIEYIIASGDNSEVYYNEPLDMMNALVGLGIPESIITLDYAGFRTFDSVVRSKKIFNQQEITIITQKFHCYRALFIANQYGINAVAYATDKVPYSSWTNIREYFARCKAVLDIFFGKEPKYLGEKIPIGRSKD